MKKGWFFLRPPRELRGEKKTEHETGAEWEVEREMCLLLHSFLLSFRDHPVSKNVFFRPAQKPRKKGVAVTIGYIRIDVDCEKK